MSNTTDTKLCIKIYTKFYIMIHIAIDGDMYSKLCQLKLSDM